jgi:branched-chain amino acid transport system permease protein
MTAKIPNFAHGTYAGFGVYVSFMCVRYFEMSPYYGFPASFLFGGLMGIFLYRIIVSTLRRMGGGAIVLTISTIAIQIFMAQFQHIFAFWTRETYGLMSYGFLLKKNDFSFEFLGQSFQGIFPISLFLVVSIVIALRWMLTQTKFGIAMKASAEDPELSSVLGINIEKVQVASWFITGGMACLAGALLPMWFMGSPGAGARLLTSCMAGSLLGGLGNIYGAIIGGFTIGVVEIIFTAQGMKMLGLWVGEYRPLIPMIATIAILLIEPSGVTGWWATWRVGGGYERLMARLGRSKEE